MRRVGIGVGLVLALARGGAAQVVTPSPQTISVQDSGTACSATGTCAAWANVSNYISLTFQLTGTCGTCTVTFEGTADGFTWFSLSATNLSSAAAATTTTATGQYSVTNLGLTGVRARLTARASGGFNVTLTRGMASSKGGGGSGSGVTSLTATANQTTVSGATGAVTVGTVQNIGTGSSPAFATIAATTVWASPFSSVTRTTASGNILLTSSSAPLQNIDPNGSDRTVTLPTNTSNLYFSFHHCGSGNTITVKDASATTVTSLTTGLTVNVVYDGTAWNVW